jgi:hypothetical protein
MRGVDREPTVNGRVAAGRLSFGLYVDACTEAGRIGFDDQGEIEETGARTSLSRGVDNPSGVGRVGAQRFLGASQQSFHISKRRIVGAEAPRDLR